MSPYQPPQTPKPHPNQPPTQSTLTPYKTLKPLTPNESDGAKKDERMQFDGRHLTTVWISVNPLNPINQTNQATIKSSTITHHQPINPLHIPTYPPTHIHHHPVSNHTPHPTTITNTNVTTTTTTTTIIPISTEPDGGSPDNLAYYPTSIFTSPSVPAPQVQVSRCQFQIQ